MRASKRRQSRHLADGDDTQTSLEACTNNVPYGGFSSDSERDAACTLAPMHRKLLTEGVIGRVQSDDHPRDRAA